MFLPEEFLDVEMVPSVGVLDSWPGGSVDLKRKLNILIKILNPKFLMKQDSLTMINLEEVPNMHLNQCNFTILFIY